jgi:replicative DNA helicase
MVKVRKTIQRSDAELGSLVLGEMLLNPLAVHELIGAMLLSVDCFVLDAHRVIFEAIRQLHGAGYSIGLATVASALVDCGTLKRAGGVANLVKLMEHVPSKYFGPMLHGQCADLRDRMLERKVRRSAAR